MTASNPPQDRVAAAILPCIAIGGSARQEPGGGIPPVLQDLLERSGFRLVHQFRESDLSGGEAPTGEVPAALAEQQQPFLLLCLGGDGIGWQLQAIRACRASVSVPFESIVLAEAASAKEIGQAVELGVIEVLIGLPSDAQAEHILSVVRERLSLQRPPPAVEPDPLEPVQSLIASAKQLSELLLQAALRLTPDRGQEPRGHAVPAHDLRAQEPPSKDKPAGQGPALSDLLSGRPDTAGHADDEADGGEAAAGGEAAEALLATVRLLMLLERIRYEALPVCTERDVHWQVLMFLVEQSLRRKEATVTAVCYATSAPFSTAIRKIDELAAVGWLSRRVDPRDRRRYIVELSQHGRRQLIAYLRRTAGELAHLKRPDLEGWSA